MYHTSYSYSSTTECYKRAMPGTISEPSPQDVAEFIENSVLDVIVPADSQLDLKKSLEEWDGDGQDDDGHLPAFVQQRPFLLLDEVVDVYVVLRTPLVSEAVLNPLLSKLEVNIETWATGIPPPPFPRHGDARPNQPPPPAKEMLHSTAVNTAEEPIVAASGTQSDDESDSKQTIYLFWKATIPLARPRMKLQKVAVFFAVSGALAPDPSLDTPSTEDYLPSGVPAAMNLLEPFSHDPTFAGVGPRLSALRITKVVPSNTITPQVARPIRTTGQKRMYRAAPPLLWRIRYSKSASPPKTNDLVASFDFEITPFASADILITDISMSLSQGVVTPFGTNLPIQCQPGDQVTCLYRLNPDPSLDELLSNESRKHQLRLHITGTALVSATCRPRLAIAWSMPVDFSTHTKFGHSRTRSTLLHQSTSIEIPRSLPPGPGPDGHRGSGSTDIERPGTSHSMTTDSGVVITISAPSEVRVGEVFTWKLFIVNRSESLVRLAVLAVSKRRTPRRGDRLSGTGGQEKRTSGTEASDEEKLAEPVVEANLLYGMLRTGEMEPAELVCLTTDLRVGPLVAAACYSTELEFLPLSPGLLRIESLRVVDLNTQDTTDIRDVPDIIAVEGQSPIHI
ncbi:hypothetical protein P152DRAFT_406846 [Eremomyces bilateralis CBS 781.70]|uniref:Trafficking protein particle complex II-specific subunit 65 IgD3 domain-containing protein n=1 Tax=Eremomyces bilateralis CBS 781.70 TaxID=1392243 RepID=A0A6G1GFV4_9PEZI|nr:uncharacterized protein P152DRAFT_406846 [Eremomyces bilateralis CBS 781.70]KAF1816791.1 hypothetical protein P152DRAFT_406846 [Eremomyces bilateralis CBS 781.70]